jgi:hypothetical protein
MYIIGSIFAWAPAAFWGVSTIVNPFIPKLLTHEEGRELTAKTAFPDVYARVDNLRKDILVYQTDQSVLQGVMGKSYWTYSCSPAVILCDEELSAIDPQAANVILKHVIRIFIHNPLDILPKKNNQGGFNLELMCQS